MIVCDICGKDAAYTLSSLNNDKGIYHMQLDLCIKCHDKFLKFVKDLKGEKCECK